METEFIRDGEEYLVITESGGLMGFERSRLADHELEILSRHDVAGHLPLEAEEVEGRVRFRYRLSGRRRLDQLLRAGALEADQYCSVLRTLCGILQKCPDYLLNEHNVLMGSQWLFAQRNLADLQVVYLPFREPRDAEETGRQLRDFALELLLKVENPERLDLRRLLQALGDEKRLQTDWHALLLPATSTPDAGAEGAIAQVGRRRKLREDGPDEPRKEPLPYDGDESRPAHGQLVLKRCLLPPAGGMGAAVFFFLAIRGHQASGWMWVAGVLCLLACAAGLHLLRCRPGPPIADKLISPLNPGRAGMISELGEEESGFQPATDGYREDGQEAGEALEQYYERLPEFTQVLGRPDQTVNLGPGRTKEEAPAPSGQIRLLIAREGEEAASRLWEAEKFVIGRQSEETDYVDDTPGVSRVHCELLRRDAGVEARDLGSVNGTYLNGERMVPYKTYPMTPEDTLRILQTRIRLAGGL